MKLGCARIAILVLLAAASARSQVINATLSGTVSDSSGALIPGVEISARHTETGVVSTTVTNESGTYRFGSLQPGPYQVTASLPGFQLQSFQLMLGTSQQIRQNFTLQVGTVTQAVEVSIAADQLLTTQAASVGNALSQKQVVDLPLVGRNVTDLATILPGVRGNGSASTTFAGITAGGAGNIGLQMDGASVNTGRFAQGLNTNVAINPDMVDEMRVVVAAIDVEGRGSAQVQIRTKSGTNAYRGSVTWNVRNSALNANSWSNNRQGLSPTWFNRHQYTATLGGPIIKNRTFFFGMFDGQSGQQKETVDAVVLTDTARQGIFRFFPGVNNGNAEVTPSGSGNTRIAPVVDLAGNPLDWTRIPGATGPMQSFSVFGDALNPGDPNRRQMDRTGFMTRLIGYMPHANAFNGGASCTTAVPCDGLNTAIHRWVRRTIGGDGSTGASADVFKREQYHIKIDHHFNPKHTLSGSFDQEYRYSDNNALSPWPNGWSGETTQDPNVITMQLTSTLAPSLLNEFRYGYRKTTLQNTAGFFHPKWGKEAFDFLPKYDGLPVIFRPALFSTHMLSCIAGTVVNCSEYGSRSPLSTWTETLSWTKGAHEIKTGIEFRFASSESWVPSGLIGAVDGGAGDVPVQGIDRVPGLLPGNISLAQNLLLSLSGSVDTIVQKFEIKEPTDTRFLDFRDTFYNPDHPNHGVGQIRNWHQNEVNFFIKDDWKVTPGFTLNVGLRYDLMRVPYILSSSGKNFTPGIIGGSQGVFGYSGRSFADWMSGGGAQKGALTQFGFIGRGTPYPRQGVWPSDRNNFGPAIGFAWSPRLGGKDRTTIRGGYQIAYQLPGNGFVNLDGDVGKSTPGLVYQPVDRGDGTFRDFSNIVYPLPVNQAPFQTIPLTERSQSFSLYAPDYTTPYVQTFTLGVTRALASSATLDVRYIGTRGLKLHSSLNLNSVDFRNNGLARALEITRAGGDAPLFDQMMKGLNMGAGIGVVGVNVSGSEALRRLGATRTLIANGDFVGVAQFLNTTNTGTVQPRGQIIAGGLLRSSGLFPENFFVANPQFADITYRNNSDSSNYHSLQTQLTLRQSHGLNYQATYTWSRSLGLVGPYRDVMNRRADYTLQPTHRTHEFRSYGTFDLPFGPGKLVARNSSGLLARAIEGWRLGTILNLSSGAPLNLVGQNTLYTAGPPDVVGAFPRKGKVVWPQNPGDIFGNYFSQQYKRVPDPSCATLASNLQQWCTLTALADANGNIVLRNAAPGQLGTLGLRAIEGPGSWDLHANMQKSIQITESKRLTFRVDASNVLNHPTPGNPTLNINVGTFGQITTKTGGRSLQAQLHLDF
jgi:hypothetical protein